MATNLHFVYTGGGSFQVDGGQLSTTPGTTSLSVTYDGSGGWDLAGDLNAGVPQLTAELVAAEDLPSRRITRFTESTGGVALPVGGGQLVTGVVEIAFLEGELATFCTFGVAKVEVASGVTIIQGERVRTDVGGFLSNVQSGFIVGRALEGGGPGPGVFVDILFAPFGLAF